MESLLSERIAIAYKGILLPRERLHAYILSLHDNRRIKQAVSDQVQVFKKGTASMSAPLFKNYWRKVLLTRTSKTRLRRSSDDTPGDQMPHYLANIL